FAQSRQQHRRQDGDDRNDHQQLDQRKCGTSPPNIWLGFHREYISYILSLRIKILSMSLLAQASTLLFQWRHWINEQPTKAPEHIDERKHPKICAPMSMRRFKNKRHNHRRESSAGVAHHIHASRECPGESAPDLHT